MVELSKVDPSLPTRWLPSFIGLDVSVIPFGGMVKSFLFCWLDRRDFTLRRHFLFGFFLDPSEGHF